MLFTGEESVVQTTAMVRWENAMTLSLCSLVLGSVSVALFAFTGLSRRNI